MNAKKAKLARRVKRMMAIYDAHGLDNAIAPENHGLMDQLIHNTVNAELAMEVPIVKTMSMEDYLLNMMEPSPEMKAKQAQGIRDYETLTGKPFPSHLVRL